VLPGVNHIGRRAYLIVAKHVDPEAAEALGFQRPLQPG